MPLLLSIVVTEDILDDVTRGPGEVRDPDVRGALKTDGKARTARRAAKEGRNAVKALEERSTTR